jgi:outer membrane lipoprotein-sorting protein
MSPIILTALFATATAAATAPAATATPAAASTTVSAAPKPVSLSTAEIETFHKNYSAHRLNVVGWTGNFHQEAHSPDLTTPITSAGNLTYRSPATLEMNYTDPLVGQVWVRNGDIGQKFTGRAPQVAAAPLVVSLLDFFRQPPHAWDKDYSIAVEKDKDLLRVKLNVKPDAEAGQPSHIEIEVNAVTLDPSRLEIDFSDQAALVFNFSNWKSLGAAPAPPPPPPPGHDPALAPSAHAPKSPTTTRPGVPSA